MKPVANDNPVPLPPFWGRRVVADLSPRLIFPFINEIALFRGQWGFSKGSSERRGIRKADGRKGPAGLRSTSAARLEEGFIEPKVVYGYFPVQAEGNDLVVYHVEEFAGCTCHAGSGSCSRTARHANGCDSIFRGRKAGGGSASPISIGLRESGEFDVLGVQLVTVGDKASELAETTACAKQVSGLPLSPRLWRGVGRGAGGVLAQAHAPGTGLRQRGQS